MTGASPSVRESESGLDWFTPRQAVRVAALGGILGGGLGLAVSWMILMRTRLIAEEEGRSVPATRYLGVGVASFGYAVVLFLVVNDFFGTGRHGIADEPPLAYLWRIFCNVLFLYGSRGLSADVMDGARVLTP